MTDFVFFILLCTLLAWQACCREVQDGWTSPTKPDESTKLQSGNPFTLVWKSNLQGDFSNYCPPCDVGQLDLWVTTFNSNKYNYKIGGTHVQQGSNPK
jgi:hypothetical protein